MARLFVFIFLLPISLLANPEWCEGDLKHFIGSPAYSVLIHADCATPFIVSPTRDSTSQLIGPYKVEREGKTIAKESLSELKKLLFENRSYSSTLSKSCHNDPDYSVVFEDDDLKIVLNVFSRCQQIEYVVYKGQDKLNEYQADCSDISQELHRVLKTSF